MLSLLFPLYIIVDNTVLLSTLTLVEKIPQKVTELQILRDFRENPNYLSKYRIRLATKIRSFIIAGQ